MRRVWAACAAAALVATGCTGSDEGPATVTPTRGDISMLQVGPSDTLAPQIVYPRDLEYTRVQSDVIWEGDGAFLVDGQPIMIDVYVVSLETNEVLRNTYDGLPESTLLAPELLGDDLYELLREERVGSRILSVAPPVGDLPSIAIVVDVLADHAQGEVLTAARDGLPIVLVDDNHVPEIVVPDEWQPPTDLVVTTLRQGQGAQVREGSYVLAQFVAVYGQDGPVPAEDPEGVPLWRAGDIRTTTWEPQNAPLETRIGMGQIIRAWDEGLMDQTAGSQVMIVAPESYAYPSEGPLIFVVDILDVWNPEAAS